MKALVLAAEGIKDRDLWYPTILGVLVVLAAVSLFMGSIYLLLATNLGARLGFLVAAAGLSGFMVLLSLPLAHDRVAAQHAEGPPTELEGGRVDQGR